MDGSFFAAVVVGLAAGYLSGQFGIGGGLVTTPAIRLLLGRPELVAVGTPLPVIVPTAIAGAVSYARRGFADVRAGVVLGLVGGACAVPGAWAATRVGGSVVLLVTAAIIVWMALDMARLAARPRSADEEVAIGTERSGAWLVVLGVVAGVYSGFLGLGGGAIVVPSLVRYFGYSAKRAVGTSLVAVSLLAIPGSVAHYALGNVDVGLAAALALGVVPGALLGARVTALARERTVRLGLAAVLFAVAVTLAAGEIGALL
jgi:hypothetical protein